MPPASGRLEGALYGSVRAAQVGGRILPSFHEGIDIAPIHRNSSGRPLDQVYAVADGTVAFVNRVAGSSNYGIYVVILHADPAGKIYTLYSHLARVSPGLQAGGEVSRGEPIGVMGSTSSPPIPRVRSHLHFEIGMIKNQHFPRWYRARRLQPDYGLYHGWNLAGIDPLEVYRADPVSPRFSMLDYLRSAPVAFEIVIPSPRQLDYFQRYPLLWEGERFRPGSIVLAVSEEGVPLRGRNASPAEEEALGDRKAVVLKVDEEVLGRNGRRLIVRRRGEWELGRNGQRWLEIFLAPGG